MTGTSGGDPMRHASREDSDVRYVIGSLVAGVVFGGIGGVAFPTLPTLGPLLGISPFVVGLILSLNRFTRVVMNTPAGQILDGLGTRGPMIVGFLLQGVVTFGYILGLHADRLPLGAATVFLSSRGFVRHRFSAGVRWGVQHDHLRHVPGRIAGNGLATYGTARASGCRLASWPAGC
jgi:MFS family permease